MSHSESHLSDAPAPVIESPVRSLAERVQARSAALAANDTITLDVPGFVGTLKAKYRLLTYRELRGIGVKNAKDTSADDIERELNGFVDTLIAACEEVLEVNADGSTTSTGKRWTPALATDLGFDEVTGARQAVYAILKRDTIVVEHHADYITWLGSASAKAEDELAANLG